MMKKLLITLLTFAALAIAVIYVFIPGKIKIAATENGNTNPKAAQRFLTNDSNWEKWWPDPTPFHHKGFTFRLTKKMFNVFELQLPDKKDTLKTILQFLPGAKDSITYLWTCEFESSKNPVVRLIQYLKATRIKKSLNILTDSLRNHLEKEENMYGFRVQLVKVSDSVLISTRRIFNHYPDDKEIDFMLQQLRKYISHNNAVEKNYPMLNVHIDGTNDYEAMVAIATDRLLPASNIFSPKLVLKGGNVLEASITGGPVAIKKAFDNFENYRSDYRISSPAIPYQLMITDRIKEPDTTKWVTKFYYPIF